MTLEERVKNSIGVLSWRIMNLEQLLHDATAENVVLKAKLKSLEPKEAPKKKDSPEDK